MKILILGGTKFVGRLCALEAVARGHQVTVFNRGTRSLPKGVTPVTGDRLEPGGYKSLEGLSFDAVIDTWADDARAVESAVDALRGRIGQYIYVSTFSVYSTEGTPRPVTEDNRLCDPETAFKAGVILGPYESSPGRVPWWLQRMERGGPTLAPGPPDNQLQFIDGRDLANFAIDGAESKLDGAFNIVSEMNCIDMQGFLDTANEVSGSNAKLCWLDADKVKESGIRPWGEMPMWLPPGDNAVYSVDVSKALKAGLHTRPAKETIADTWTWMKSPEYVDETSPQVGLDPDKESKALKQYFGDS